MKKKQLTNKTVIELSVIVKFRSVATVLWLLRSKRDKTLQFIGEQSDFGFGRVLEFCV